MRGRFVLWLARKLTAAGARLELWELERRIRRMEERYPELLVPPHHPLFDRLRDGDPVYPKFIWGPHWDEEER